MHDLGNPYRSPRSGYELAAGSTPWWVRFALCWVRDRYTATCWLWFSFLAGLIFFPMLAVALWYWLAIRWMDRHDAWQIAEPIGTTWRPIS